MNVHRFDVRVYFEDTDFSGNVYHAAYLKFCERARTEWLRDRGVHHSVLIEKGESFAVRQMEIYFDAPAHIDDLLVVETRVADRSGARVVLDQVIRRGETVLTRAKVTVVLLAPSGRPLRIPANLIEG